MASGAAMAAICTKIAVCRLDVSKVCNILELYSKSAVMLSVISSHYENEFVNRLCVLYLSW
jgi:hypothetical protein